MPKNEPTALTMQHGAFAELLAPLTKETFREVITQVEQNLQVVKQVFSLLDLQDVDSLLQEMLLALTLKTGELLGADRATLFLVDWSREQLWSVVAQGDGGDTLEIRIPIDRGIAGEVARTGAAIQIPYDFYDDPRSELAREQEKRFGYRTYTMLALPLFDNEGKVLAVAQLLNKLQETHSASSMAEIILPGGELGGDLTAAQLINRIDRNGFTQDDLQLFSKFAPSIQLILELSRSFYQVSQQQRATTALMEAVRSLSQSSLDLEVTLRRVMEEARKLMSADRATFWLLDRETGELWAKVPLSDGSMRELRVPWGEGYVGKVATSGQKVNIPFDLYNHADSETAKRLDRSTAYRTCNLLCMPILNENGSLIGVTQLINKRRQGDFPPYDPKDWPTAPECFRASFQASDEEFMETFNIQAGVALQNAQLFARVQQQEQMQRNILRNLSNAVFSTDANGIVVMVNQSGRDLLGAKSREDLKGKHICEIIQTRDQQFQARLEAALKGTEEKDRRQYYPDRVLLSPDGKEHSVDLSISSVVDYSDTTHARGALVVLDDISDEKRLKTTMYRYMSQELAEELLKLEDAGLGGDRKDVSILFSDIRSYTSLTESLEAEEVVHMLNEYFELMVEAIFLHKGTLDKFIGDAIMAVFGSPMPVEEHEWMSIQTAVEMRNRLEVLNERRKRSELRPLKIGIGVNSDVVISGHIGSSKRMEFTAIGDGVNLASRLEGVTKLYGCDIIISDRTYQRCKDRVEVRELDFVRVKGKTKPVAIYELLAVTEGPLAGKLKPKQKALRKHYHRARKLCLKRDFTGALEELNRALEIEPLDQASRLFVHRCEDWQTNPPPEEWDGAWTLTEK